MKKLFSLLTLALLTMSAWAQTTVTLDFTSNDEWNLPTAYTVEQNTYTNGAGYTITLEGTTGAGYKYAGGYLILGKNGATLSLPAFQYPVSKIEVEGRTGASGKVTQNFYVDTIPVSTETTGATGTYVYEIDDDYQAAGNIYTLRVTNGNNTQITKINITLEDGSTPVETIAAPVFNPNGGKFTETSLEVTVTCEDSPCDIYVFEGDAVDWTANYWYYNAPFYVTETKTYTAIAYKGGLESDPTTVTFTKVNPAPANTFLPSDYDAVTSSAFSVVKDGVTFACNNGTITDTQFRIFKNSTATFTAGEGVADIVKIEFTCTADTTDKYGPGCFTLADKNGTYTYEGNIGTWTGKTNSVAFTASADQVRATQIVFTLDDGTTAYVLEPTLPESCEFENEMTVAITNNEEGATVMYALNEGEYTEYSAPFTITETTTVKAYAEYDGVRSNVVSATYTLKEASGDITTLAQVNALDNNTVFEFKGDAVVTAQEGAYLWLRDESGYGLIYGSINGASDVTFMNGQVLTQGWTAKKTTYNGLIEYTGSQNVSASGVTNTTLAAIQTITELSADMINAYVQVLNVKSFTVSGKNVTANFEDGTTMVMFNQFNKEIPTTEGNYTVKGAVGRYAKNSTDQLQLYIISIDGYEPEVYDVNNIAEALALTDNATFTMYNDVVVTYQNGKSLWIRDTDNNSGLIFGTVEGTFENGQVLSDGWTAKKTIYNNVPEFTEPKDVEAAGDETREAAPFERTTITNDNVNEYVILKNITVLTDSSNTKRFYNAADSLVLYNQFNLTLNIEDGKNYDVVGIATIYYGKPELYIISATEVAAAGLRGDVNLDNAVNIADVTSLIDYLLSGDATGISVANADCNQDNAVNIADVTSLIDFLLSGTW